MILLDKSLENQPKSKLATLIYKLNQAAEAQDHESTEEPELAHPRSSPLGSPDMQQPISGIEDRRGRGAAGGAH